MILYTNYIIFASDIFIQPDMQNYFMERAITAIPRFFHRRGFGIQSPWAYEMVTDVLFETLPYYHFIGLRKIKKSMETDFINSCKGGENIDNSCIRMNLQSQKDDEQLFRIANYLRPTSILEVGIGSGSSLCYLASPHPNTPCLGISSFVHESLKKLATKIDLKIKEGDEILLTQKYLEENELPEILHILCTNNAERIYELMAKAYENSFNHDVQPNIRRAAHLTTPFVPLIIIERINGECRQLWHKILDDSRATITFDLGKRGLAFFDSKRTKQNYKL